MTTATVEHESPVIQAAKPLFGNMERKSFDIEVKDVDDSGSFSGYFAVFSNIDRTLDVIEPGAFKNLADFERDGFIGVNHLMDRLPVATISSATQDSHGLKISGQFHSHDEAQACRSVIVERLARSKSVKCSIGYRTTDSAPSYQDGKSIRKLRGIDLFEASFVAIPANERAEAVSAKSLPPASPQADLVSVVSADEPLTPEGDPMPDLYSLDEVKTLLDEVRTKAGRVISKANHEKLTDYADKLDEHGESAKCMAQDMKSWLGQVKPPGADEPDEDDKPDKPADKDIIPQDRAAGNSLPADQNPHGAVTADDLAKRKAAKAVSLDALRQRVLKDLTRFHSLSS
jgi:uncharacterized protein